MNTPIEYHLNKASAAQIEEHLRLCDVDFLPPLSSRVKINKYAEKISANAARFEAWSGNVLVGLVAAYCNNQANRIAYITSVSVLKEWTSKGIAASLLAQCIEHAKNTGMKRIHLEVARENMPVIRLYEKFGFVLAKSDMPFIMMNLYLNSGDEHEQHA